MKDRRRQKLLERIVDEGGRAGTISEQGMAELSREYDVPLSTVRSLATFYLSEGREARRVCTGLPCDLKGSRGVAERFAREGVGYSKAACLGYCDHAPVVWTDGRFYRSDGGTLLEIEESKLANIRRGTVSFEGYRRTGGYDSLRRFARESDRSLLVEELEKASLRGMGGAGFPTHLKWRAIMKGPEEERYLIVNAHEGEPGTFKDRVLMEREPHRLLEGVLIAALAVGAQQVIIAMKREYENARTVLSQSLDELLSNISALDLGVPLPRVSVVTLAGSYVTGEETALIEAIEGNRSEPRLRPPFPVESGLYGKPTLVQNVETLAVIPGVLKRRYDGSPPGGHPKYYCLTGDVPRPGAYRKEMGAAARELLGDGGLPEAEGVKALLPGGLSGGLLPASELSIHLDFDSVRKKGAGLGTGAVICLSKERCVVDVLGNISDFFAAESCGKCVPCRLGTTELSSLMRSLGEGQATRGDLARGEETARAMQETSICALGQAAGKAFLDAMRFFGEEMGAHAEGRCAARVCFDGRKG